MRSGLGPNGSEHTLEEVGQRFAVTRERIRRIEARALRQTPPSVEVAEAEGVLGKRKAVGPRRLKSKRQSSVDDWRFDCAAVSEQSTSAHSV
jgi:hypothetical protein